MEYDIKSVNLNSAKTLVADRNTFGKFRVETLFYDKDRRGEDIPATALKTEWDKFYGPMAQLLKTGVSPDPNDPELDSPFDTPFLNKIIKEMSYKEMENMFMITPTDLSQDMGEPIVFYGYKNPKEVMDDIEQQWADRADMLTSPTTMALNVMNNNNKLVQMDFVIIDDEQSLEKLTEFACELFAKTVYEGTDEQQDYLHERFVRTGQVEYSNALSFIGAGRKMTRFCKHGEPWQPATTAQKSNDLKL